MLLSAARAHVGYNTSDFSLLFAEAAVVGLVLYSAQSQRVGITPPYLGVLEAVGFHVSNSLVNGLMRAGVGISSSFALQGLLRALAVQDRLVGVCMVGSTARPGGNPKTKHQIYLVWITSRRGRFAGGVCWERISPGVLRQDVFLLHSKGGMFMGV